MELETNSTDNMSQPKKSVIEVHGTAVSIHSGKDGDYISLTDMLQAKDGEFFISDWLRNRNTVEFLGIWPQLKVRPVSTATRSA